MSFMLYPLVFYNFIRHSAALTETEPLGTVAPGRVAFGFAAATVTGSSHLTCHPLSGVELAFQQRRDIHVGVQLWLVQPSPVGEISISANASGVASTRPSTRAGGIASSRPVCRCTITRWVRWS